MVRFVFFLFLLICGPNVLAQQDKIAIFQDDFQLYLDEGAEEFEWYNASDNLFFVTGSYKIDTLENKIHFKIKDSIVIESVEGYQYFNNYLDSTEINLFVELLHFSLPIECYPDSLILEINEHQYNYDRNKGVRLNRTENQSLNIKFLGHDFFLEVNSSVNCISFTAICKFTTVGFSAQEKPMFFKINDVHLIANWE